MSKIASTLNDKACMQSEVKALKWIFYLPFLRRHFNSLKSMKCVFHTYAFNIFQLYFYVSARVKIGDFGCFDLKIIKILVLNPHIGGISIFCLGRTRLKLVWLDVFDKMSCTIIIQLLAGYHFMVCGGCYHGVIESFNFAE